MQRHPLLDAEIVYGESSMVVLHHPEHIRLVQLRQRTNGD
jgi:hypothetical protein